MVNVQVLNIDKKMGVAFLNSDPTNKKANFSALFDFTQ